MFKAAESRAARQHRHQRIRKRVHGTPERPRLCVFRSLNHIYAQVIDDSRGVTLAAASSMEPEARSAAGAKSARAKNVGVAIAQRALAAGVRTVVFDRGGYLYHGRVQQLADGAREGGLEF